MGAAQGPTCLPRCSNPQDKTCISIVQTRGIAKTSGFTTDDFIKLKGFLVEFSENRRSSENQKKQKITRKVDFPEPRLLQYTLFAHC